jgi:hypothetical protein
VDTDLGSARDLYKDARYEDAQRWLLELERDLRSMDMYQRTRFYYLRGMTAFRLGQRDDALHYLALTAELSDRDLAHLPADWRPVMERTLQELMPREATSHAENRLR